MRIENEDGGEKVNTHTNTNTNQTPLLFCVCGLPGSKNPPPFDEWMEDGGGKCHKHLALRELEMYSWE
jgi:hypothetical protein